MNDVKADAKNSRKDYAKLIFINASKSIIKSDGVSHVTARRIAEMTGYSYTSFYHYFSDMDDLLLNTKLDMIRDMVNESIEKEKTIQAADPLQRIKAKARFPIDYFMDNPNIFGFFYLYKMDERNITAMRSLEIEKAYRDDFLPFTEKGTIKHSDIPAIARTILYAVYGMITLCLSNNGLTKEDVYHDMDEMIDLLLKGDKNNENP